ncbi:MAG: hypothetical protein ACKVQJ_04800 [Pyrinomonadaceae bacterium]
MQFYYEQPQSAMVSTKLKLFLWNMWYVQTVLTKLKFVMTNPGNMCIMINGVLLDQDGRRPYAPRPLLSTTA